MNLPGAEVQEIRTTLSADEGFVDLLRAVAVTLVVITHAAQPFTSLPIAKLAAFGQIGVQIFFVLSAFTLCASVARLNSFRSFPTFIGRRFFRIWPAYSVGILLYSVLPLMVTGQALYSKANWTDVSFNVLLLHGFSIHASNSVVPGGWSIGTEWLFYLAFLPIASFIRNNLKYIVITLLLYCIALLLIFYWLINNGTLSIEDIRLNSFINLSLIVQIPVFFIGFMAHSLVISRSATEKQALTCAALGIIGIFGGWLLFPVVLRSLAVPWFSAQLTLGLICFLSKRTQPIPFIIRRLGKVSYSVYLFHFIIAWSAPWQAYLQQMQITGLVVHVCLTLAFSYLLAEISYRLIEVPGQAFGKRVLQPKRILVTL
jgi:peptidoglycan/LPS O-acetylase OafA/YrhL